MLHSLTRPNLSILDESHIVWNQSCNGLNLDDFTLERNVWVIAARLYEPSEKSDVRNDVTDRVIRRTPVAMLKKILQVHLYINAQLIYA